ncbi:hypothetical protein [Paenibacillus sp. NPDC057967]|uniref:hypothetical protein n=1 Tax=Paenibacillus sp. NPDC057967 TaxID=3346293 RepID=UPI0036D76F67
MNWLETIWAHLQRKARLSLHFIISAGIEEISNSCQTKTQKKKTDFSMAYVYARKKIATAPPRQEDTLQPASCRLHSMDTPSSQPAYYASRSIKPID